METFLCGPSGGTGGNRFLDDISVDLFIIAIQVWSGSYIDAIQLTFDDNSTTEKHGGSGGSPWVTPAFLPGERVIELSGSYGDYIDSLTIRTTLQTFPALGGGGGGKEFRYHIPDNMHIAGLFGASGSYLDALGVFYRQFPA